MSEDKANKPAFERAVMQQKEHQRPLQGSELDKFIFREDDKAPAQYKPTGHVYIL